MVQVRQIGTKRKAKRTRYVSLSIRDKVACLGRFARIRVTAAVRPS